MTNNTTEKSARLLQMEARQARVAVATRPPQVVRVVPKNDLMRRTLKHMPSRTAFPENGAAIWPYDQFTKRRLRDGDVTIEQKEEPKQEENPRRHRAHAE